MPLGDLLVDGGGVDFDFSVLSAARQIRWRRGYPGRQTAETGPVFLDGSSVAGTVDSVVDGGGP